MTWYFVKQKLVSSQFCYHECFINESWL